MSKTSTVSPVAVAAPIIPTIATIGQSELEIHFAAVRGGQFVSITADTAVSRIGGGKSGKYFGVRKTATVRFQWGLSYVAARQRIDPSFTPDSRAWGEALKSSPGFDKMENKFVHYEKDGEQKHYVTVINGETIESSHYFPNGKQLTEAEVKDMYDNHMQPAYYTTPKPIVKYQNYTISNIKGANFGGEQYIIR